MPTREIEAAELDQMVGPPRLATRLGRSARWLTRKAVFHGRRKFKEWRVGANLPGMAGIGLVSAGVGLVVSAAAGAQFGLGSAFLALGFFSLRIDSRL